MHLKPSLTISSPIFVLQTAEFGLEEEELLERDSEHESDTANDYSEDSADDDEEEDDEVETESGEDDSAVCSTKMGAPIFVLQTAESSSPLSVSTSSSSSSSSSAESSE